MKRITKIVLEMTILIGSILFFRFVWDAEVWQICLVMIALILFAWVLAKVIRLEYLEYHS